MSRRAYNFIDLQWQRFGRWLVLEYAYIRNGRAYWKCLCACGTIKIVSGTSLTSGNTKSCGCWNVEKIIERNKLGHSEETRKKMSEARIGKYCGENCPAWNPNLTDEERQDRRKYPEYYEWRKRIFDRDNYTCQCCFKLCSIILNAHHLEGYRNNPELRTVLSNGVTLCEECHKNFHHQYGRVSNTKEQFKEFKESCYGN